MNNQERIALNEMLRESGQDLTTMINNRDSQTMDDSEQSEINKSKLGQEIEWNCDLEAMLENLQESKFFDFEEVTNQFNQVILSI